MRKSRQAGGPTNSDLRGDAFGHVKCATVCGEPYTNLAWYFGKAPTSSQRKRVHSCPLQSDAVRLIHGDQSSLGSKGQAFVSDEPAKRKELLPREADVPAQATASECVAARASGGRVEIRRPWFATGANVRWRSGALDNLPPADEDA